MDNFHKFCEGFPCKEVLLTGVVVAIGAMESAFAYFVWRNFTPPPATVPQPIQLVDVENGHNPPLNSSDSHLQPDKLASSEVQEVNKSSLFVPVKSELSKPVPVKPFLDFDKPGMGEAPDETGPSGIQMDELPNVIAWLTKPDHPYDSSGYSSCTSMMGEDKLTGSKAVPDPAPKRPRKPVNIDRSEVAKLWHVDLEQPFAVFKMRASMEKRKRVEDALKELEKSDRRLPKWHPLIHGCARLKQNFGGFSPDAVDSSPDVGRRPLYSNCGLPATIVEVQDETLDVEAIEADAATPTPWIDDIGEYPPAEPANCETPVPTYESLFPESCEGSHVPDDPKVQDGPDQKGSRNS
ncbi:hypothetical protein L596_000325 [Steinernema carpocapsae]|uniref:Uncharacterized protein n=1 Tax=Steinernema carpocapsae TaxID=34508 RepID=A0A4U8UK84_STECR|nr:hypothetical protein L596_000325 [Steinernema carpocapsae]